MLTKLGVTSSDDINVSLLIAPFVIGVLYRAGREVEARWPRLGFVLFGSSQVPEYKPQI